MNDTRRREAKDVRGELALLALDGHAARRVPERRLERDHHLRVERHDAALHVLERLICGVCAAVDRRLRQRRAEFVPLRHERGHRGRPARAHGRAHALHVRGRAHAHRARVFRLLGAPRVAGRGMRLGLELVVAAAAAGAPLAAGPAAELGGRGRRPQRGRVLARPRVGRRARAAGRAPERLREGHGAAAGALLAATAAADAGGARQRRLRSARAQPAGAEVRRTSSHLV